MAELTNGKDAQGHLVDPMTLARLTGGSPDYIGTILIGQTRYNADGLRRLIDIANLGIGIDDASRDEWIITACLELGGNYAGMNLGDLIMWDEDDDDYDEAQELSAASPNLQAQGLPYGAAPIDAGNLWRREQKLRDPITGLGFTETQAGIIYDHLHRGDEAAPAAAAEERHKGGTRGDKRRSKKRKKKLARKRKKARKTARKEQQQWIEEKRNDELAVGYEADDQAENNQAENNQAENNQAENNRAENNRAYIKLRHTAKKANRPPVFSPVPQPWTKNNINYLRGKRVWVTKNDGVEVVGTVQWIAGSGAGFFLQLQTNNDEQLVAHNVGPFIFEKFEYERPPMMGGNTPKSKTRKSKTRKSKTPKKSKTRKSRLGPPPSAVPPPPPIIKCSAFNTEKRDHKKMLEKEERKRKKSRVSRKKRQEKKRVKDMTEQVVCEVRRMFSKRTPSPYDFEKEMREWLEREERKRRRRRTRRRYGGRRRKKRRR